MTDQLRHHRLKICHIITGLPVGGAQTMLSELLSRMNRDRFSQSVISLIDEGAVGRRLKQDGFTVRALNMSPNRPNPLLLIRLARWIVEANADIVQTWLYHGDVVGGIAAFATGRRRIVWNIRHSVLDAESDKKATIWTARIAARLSRHVPRAILCNSVKAADLHIARGYDARKVRIIPNGVDTTRHRPDPEAYHSVRTELGRPDSCRLIGLVGRYHPLKGHATFLTAARHLVSRSPQVEFLAVGEGVSPANTELTAQITDLGLTGKVHLLGLRSDIPRLTAALDIATSASYGEALSNIIIEAMACGVPCVVTDVGDSAAVIDDTGWVVPPHDAQALSAAWLDALSLPPSQWDARKGAARRRACAHYDIGRITQEYEDFYASLMTAPGD